MKKEDISGLVVYMIIIASAVIYSLTVLRVHFDESMFNKSVLTYGAYILVTILIGILLAALLSEIGHVIGAKIGGYSILSVTCIYLSIYKDNKWKVGFKSFDGLTGETKIMPKKENANPTSFLVLPNILMALFAVISFVLFYVLNGEKGIQSDIAFSLLTIFVILMICLVYNIIPIKLDSRTDGYELKLVRSKEQKEAYNEMLKVGHAVTTGETTVDAKEYKEVNNITAELSLDRVLLLLYKEEYDDANQLIDKILNEKTKAGSKNELRSFALKTYIQAVTKSEEEFLTYINENADLSVRRELSNDNSFVSIRAYLLIAGLVDNSKSECLLTIKNVQGALRATPKDRKNSEASMYNNVIELVNKKHPNWELTKYKIIL